MLGEMFAGVPVEFTNSVVAHATFHRCRTEDYPFAGPHLFVFVGHGVAGAWMDDPIEADALPPVELGHMVFGDGGPRCRCGHHGCVEAYTSLPALAELLGVRRAGIAAARRRVGECDPDHVARAPGVAAPAVPAWPCDRQYAEREALSRRGHQRLAVASRGSRIARLWSTGSTPV